MNRKIRSKGKNFQTPHFYLRIESLLHTERVNQLLRVRRNEIAKISMGRMESLTCRQELAEVLGSIFINDDFTTIGLIRPTRKLSESLVITLLVREHCRISQEQKCQPHLKCKYFNFFKNISMDVSCKELVEIDITARNTNVVYTTTTELIGISWFDID